MPVGYISAVAVPVGQGGAVIHVVIDGMSQSPEHHIFVIAQNQLGVGHGHELSQDPQAPGMPVDDIAQNIEGVLRLQVDLLQDGQKPPLVAVDIGEDVVHKLLLFSLFPHYSTEKSLPQAGLAAGWGNYAGVAD